MSKAPPPHQKWQSAAASAHYAGERFSTTRARERDPRLVRRLWSRHGANLAGERILDLPCGTGRLAESLESLGGEYLGADVSPAMLHRVPATALVADALHLPFTDRSFKLVVCCRLLHHLDEGDELAGAVAELARVSSGLIIASFWDSASWPAWRRRLGWRVDTSGRRPVSKARLEACFAAAGAEVVEYAHSLRFLAMQTFAAARVPLEP